MSGPTIFYNLENAADWIEKKFGPNISIAAPLAQGKPNKLLNILYTRTKNRSDRKLKIFTALSLQPPKAESDLQKRFLDPFVKRHFGENYPELLYNHDLARNRLPKNIEIHEFYCQVGSALSNLERQRNYISLNYTHVAQAIVEYEIPLLLCLIAKHPSGKNVYSLSCNPDLTLDVVDLYKKSGKKMSVVGVIHPKLPYMTEDAEVSDDFFDVIIESDEIDYELFALPREVVDEKSFLIGLQASLLLPDDGTIQIGIGSLSDALTYSLVLRQKHSELYREITDELISSRFSAILFHEFHQSPFKIGVYGTSEMIMDAFMHLRRADILKREIKDADENIRRYLHGAFFLGSKEFYHWMSERFQENDHGLSMTRVSKVNDLYDPHELALRRQRKNARFFNIAMSATILGGVAADTLENGQVLSGVGGQYNFVSMSHELPDSHSVILLHSHRVDNGKKISNIVWGHGQQTIPRHLRDVFVTEYGIAFTRNKTDEEVVRSMIEITDSEFQEALIKKAIQNKKLSPSYQLPAHARNNTKEKVTEFLRPYKKQGFFSPFPFGSDFTPVEEKILFALLLLKEALPFKTKMLGILQKGFNVDQTHYREILERMDLYFPKNFTEKIYQRVLLGALISS